MTKHFTGVTLFWFAATICCTAQAGYQYNGATGRYEYNTDPLGGMAQRYQDYTNMQIATMQRMNANTMANNQAMLNGTNGISGNNLMAEINAAVARGKQKIAAGKAANSFNWVYGSNVTGAQKNMAASIKNVIESHGLNANDYCDAKAFFALTFYAVYKESADEYRLEKKGEAKRTQQEYLTNEYVQGMTDAEKTNNLLYDINVLALIKDAGLTTASAKKIAANALESRGFSHPSNLVVSTNGLLAKGAAVISAGKAKTTFVRSKENIFITEAINAGNITQQQKAAMLKYMDAFDAVVKKINGPDNDHAFSQSLMFAFYYTIYTDGKTLSAKQLDTVVKMFHQDLVSSKDFQSLPDEKLQSFYERLSIECMILSDRYANAKVAVKKFEEKLNDPKQDAMEKLSMSANTKVYDDMNTIKELAHKQLRDFFKPRNYDEFVLTENGFKKK